MTTENDGFDPYDLDAIDRAQREQDGELEQEGTGTQGEGSGDGAGEGGDTAAGTGSGEGGADGEAAGNGEGAGDGADAVDGTGEADETPPRAEDTSKPAKPAGVASKDGTRVLPYSALQQAREDSRQAKAELARAKAEIDVLKKGATQATGAPDSNDDDLSEEELDQIVADFPQLSKVVKAVTSAKTKLAQMEKARPASGTQDDDGHQAEPSGDPVQDAIDLVPDLLTWQTESEHASKFQRAQEVDNFLKSSPKWQSKSLADRFEEAARIVRAEFDVDEPTPTASQTTTRSTKPTAPKKEVAREVINRTQRRGPTTLSDLKGGASPAVNNTGALTPTAMLSRFEGMSTEEMLAELDRGG